jgi:uncharacterized protein (DUF1810 family)
LFTFSEFLAIYNVRYNKKMAEENINSNEGLERFLTAQDGKRGNTTLYELALKEIQEGKLGFECWIRYVYPQLKGLGTSQVTEFFGINGREEAQQYINHPILKERLIRAAQVLLDIDKPIYETFSKLGILKIRASMLLFSSVSDDPVFKQVLRKYGWK